MDISVIIVNYNTVGHLVKCLNSIDEFSKDVKYEVVVVDNHSPQRDIENLPSQFPNVKFFLRDVNDGFGSGCNFGVGKAEAESKYIAFINPDIIFIENSLGKFFDYMESKDDVAACSGLLVNSKGEILYSYNYDMDIMWELRCSFKIGLENFKKKLINRKEVIIGVPFEIDWALGACLFVRKDAYNAVKGFDEDFFLYTEDNDLQYRLRKKGGKITCIPSVRNIHYYGSSMDDEESKSYYNYFFYKSKMLYIYKHFNFFKRNVIRLILIVGLLMRFVKAAFFNSCSKRIIKEQLFPALVATLRYYKVASQQ
jgi:hypothetical protein